MLSGAAFDPVTACIRSASASMEERFLDVGHRLGEAVDTIGTLTQTFDRLASELKGDNLRDATQELAQIMSRVAALARVHDDERAAFECLAELTSRIQERVVRMGLAVGNIGMLAINARIEAVAIGDAGLDFVGFTSDIGRALHLAQTNLDQFIAELRGVGGHLRAAVAGQLALAQRQAAAISSVPVRLAESIGSITDSGTRAVTAASAVAQRSRQVGQSISDAVMALQIGDITRQRLEHMEYALRLIVEVLEPPAHAGSLGQDAWSTLPSRQRDALAVLCGRLLSAQLLDAADEFDREMRRILSSVQELALDAEDILRLGNAAVGAADDRRGTFLGKVEEQAAEVEILLKGLATARREADTVGTSVSKATARLVSHTSSLTSLEEDIRLMGLNMSLKCGRLAAVGRPLMVIAQELRSCSNQIAAEASIVGVNLDAMVTTTTSLSDSAHEERAAEIAAVATIMADSVSRLSAAGENLTDALTTLARDTESVALLLRDTVARAAIHEELSAILRQAASDLMSTAANEDSEGGIDTPEAARMLDLLMRSYTMERERIVHNRHFNLPTSQTDLVAASPDTTAPAAAQVEDVFF